MLCFWFCLWALGNIFVVVNGSAVSGAAGWSGYFDGNNHISIATDCSIIDCKSVPSSISGAFTFSLFLRPQFDGTVTSDVSLLSLDDVLSINLSVQNGEIQSIILDNLAASWSTNQFISSSQNIPNATWTHLSITFSANIGFTILLNGAVSWTTGLPAYPSPFSDSTTFSHWIIGDGFVGEMDEIYVFDKALSETTISNNLLFEYDSNSQRDSGSIVLYFGFNDGAGDLVRDSTSNHNDGDIVDYESMTVPFWRMSGVDLEDQYTISEDDQLVIPLHGFIADSFFINHAVNISITRLPSKGTLYQINRYQQRTESITSVPMLVSDPGLRVMFIPNYGEYSGSSSSYSSFDYAVSSDQVLNNETVSIQVLSVKDLISLHMAPESSDNPHRIHIRGLSVFCHDQDTNVSVSISTESANPVTLADNTGLSVTTNTTSNLSFFGQCNDVNLGLEQLTQTRNDYVWNRTDILSVTVSALEPGRYDWGGQLTTTKHIGFGAVLGIPPHIDHIEPTLVTNDGHSIVTITGYDFLYSEYRCIFSHNDSVQIIPTDVTFHQMRCAVPSGGSAGSSTLLYIQSMHNAFRSRSVTLWFRDIAVIESVEPALGDVVGGTLVTVHSVNHSFFPSPTLQCSFNHILVAAQFISPDLITCFSPPYPFGDIAVPFRVEMDQWHFDDSANWTFFYFQHPRILSLEPDRGYIEGGITVMIRGEHFVTTSDHNEVVALCRFGDDHSYYPSAVVLNSTTMSCSAPPHSAGFVRVQISLNDGGDWTDDVVLFEFMDIPRTFGLFPSIGPKSGGTNLTISSEHIRIDLAHFCVFHSNDTTLNTTATAVFEDQIECPTPFWSTAMIDDGTLFQSVEVTVESEWYQLTAPMTMEFVFIEEPSISSIDRDFVDQRGDIWIIIIGQHFLKHDNLTLYFNESTSIEYQWLDTEHLKFYLSASMIAGHVGQCSLHLNIGNFQHFTDRFYFNVTQNAQFLSITPSIGRFVGGTTVSIEMANIWFTPDIACRFDADPNSVVAATFINESWIQCVTPPMALPSMDSDVMVQIGVTLNGIDFFDSPSFGIANFTYHSPIEINEISPTFGPLTGSTVITLFGTNFVDGMLYRIGSDAPNTVSFVSSTEIEIVSPSRIEPVIEGIAFSKTEGREWTETLTTFQWINDLNITAFEPTHGPRSGGTRLLIHGDHFRNSSLFQCRFMVQFNASYDFMVTQSITEYVSPSMVSCTTPINMTNDSALSVAITNNGQQWVTFTEYNYLFDELVTVSSVQPSFGSNIGGTVLNITGNGFVETTSNGEDVLLCRFTYSSDGHGAADQHQQDQIAEFIDNQHLQCITPSFSVHKPNGNVTISVSINGVDFSIDTVSFTIYDDPIVSALSPDSGPFDASTAVTIYGQHFRSDTLVRFESDSVYYSLTSSDIVVVDSNRIDIVTLNFSDSVGYRLTVEVSLNGHDWTRDGVLFYLYDPTVIDEMSPTFGPTAGGTVVTFKGNHFVDSGQFLCDFGNISTLGHVINKDYASCITPTVGTNHSVIVRLTNNDQDYTVSTPSFTFYYHSPLSITSIYPSRGFVSGGNPVILTLNDNEHWSSLSNDTAYCRFGERMIESDLMISEESGTNISCIAPHQDYSRNVSVEISLNGIDWTTDQIQFYYQSFPAVFHILPPRGPVGGGTTLTLYGQHFETPMFCRFGDDGSLSPVTATVVTSTEMTCITPSIGSAQVVNVEVSNNLEWFTRQKVAFSYEPMESVSAVSPSLGTLLGGTVVTVYGQDFIDSELLFCRFGSNTVSATYLSAERINCIAPQSITAEMVTVEVSNNGQDFTANGVLFQYHLHPVITEIVPSSGPIGGGTLLEIHGENFTNSTSMMCLFGDRPQRFATFINSSLITCLSSATPRMEDHDVIFQFTMNALDYYSNNQSLIWNFYPSPHIRYFVPSFMEIGFYDDILVHGTFFKNDSGIKCKFFGPEEVTSGTFLSSTLVSCPTSGAHTVGNAKIEIAINGNHYTEDDTTFSWINRINISSINPNIGSIEGGTKVVVHGTNFMNRYTYKCRFGSTESDQLASWIDTETIHCITPNVTPFPSDHGVVFVEISCDSGSHYSTESRVTFQFHSQFVITALDPPTTSIRGGQQISIIGSGLNISSNMAPDVLYCKFEDIVSVATVINDSMIQCVNPPVTESKGVTLYISSNAADWTSVGIEFVYYDLPEISYIEPPFGPAAGGTTVTIYGEHIVNNTVYPGQHQCRFGSQIVSATLMQIGNDPNNTVMVCESPPKLSAVGENRSVALDISCDGGIEFTHSIKQFWYHNDLTLTKLTPTNFGPLTGNTKLFITGSGFADLYHYLKCKFSSLDASRSVIVSATFITQQLVRCDTPLWTISEVVQITITRNGQDFSSSSLNFTYHPDITVTSIYPTFGPLSGNTALTITATSGGFNFSGIDAMNPISAIHSMTYKFVDQFGNTVKEDFIDDLLSDSTIRCTTPVLIHKALELMPFVYFDIALNGHDYIFGNSVQFQFTENILLRNLHPTHVPTLGGSLIYVDGANFLNLSTTKVKVTGDTISESELIPISITNNEIIFETPAISPSESIQIVTIEVTNNGVDYTDFHLQFTYYDTPFLESLSPLSGIETSNDSVKVYGSNFIPSVDLHCLWTALEVTFSSDPNGTNYQFDAMRGTYYRSDLVYCPPPPISMWSISEISTSRTAAPWYIDTIFRLQLSFNAVDYTNPITNSLNYTILAVPTFVELSPPMGPTHGGTLVTIKGSNFGNLAEHHLFCKFGGHRRVAIVSRNDSAIQCLSPSIDIGPDSNGPVIRSGYTVFVYVHYGDMVLDIDGLLSFEFYEELQITDVTPYWGPKVG